MSAAAGPVPELLTARDNPLLQRIRRLTADPGAYRRQGAVWLEGDHLVGAALARGVALDTLVVSQGAWQDRLAPWQGWATRARRAVQVPDALFASVSGLDSPGRLGALIERPPAPPVDPAAGAVVLDRLQDAGNVGSILRSAAAFGVPQVIALKGTAALWSAKVLRAGMGAHFALRLIEAVDADALDVLQVPLLATSPHGGLLLGESPLPRPCAWVLGHEGQGVSPALMARCAHAVRIPQPGGEESLNVAAAAAVCLFAGLALGAAPGQAAQ
ncbi:TrmH family RNA methyltransferase [Ideonella sp.]|uniref:TrmH family RNA methyltransferase n=1 Tax=Ideonella sp. TaxID=1929293 RepID=UPI0035B4DC83